MTRFEGHQRKINKPAETVFSFISDFNNFQDTIPQDKIQNWQATADTCSFTVAGVGEMAMQIVEKKPFNLIKIENQAKAKNEFMLWVQLKQIDEQDTRLKITFDVRLNAMLKMMAKKPLQNFIGTLTDRIAESFNQR
ncbi:MAG: SRPBCC family protein [Bacteroidota bacterium]|nr:SRPBCC family protein [Bacteroidota bacterium]